MAERRKSAKPGEAAPTSAEERLASEKLPVTESGAVEQLRQIKDGEYRRYLAARAMRALREDEDDTPVSADFRRVVALVGVIGRWKRRKRPDLLRMAAPPRDPELPDELQSPLPQYSRWLFEPTANELFSVFRGSSNPVEDFYLKPMDDKWRSQRHGVYGLRYEKYPNPGAIAVPEDGEGLYMRTTKKMLKTPDGARPARRPGVVTLQHVKAVAEHAVAQFFPAVHARPGFFDKWPRIDDVLGSVLEYFFHYFELRRLEESMAQLQCRLYDSAQMDERRRRMDECVAETGSVYSTYLLGAGVPFHHLNRGASYQSAAATDRQMFEALYAYVAQVVWIAFRRPNVTVIVREVGRLFRTSSFDIARRMTPTVMDEPQPAASATRRAGQGRSRQDLGRRGTSEKRIQGAGSAGTGTGSSNGHQRGGQRRSGQQQQTPSSIKSEVKQAADAGPSVSGSQGTASERRGSAVQTPVSNVHFSSQGTASPLTEAADSPTSEHAEEGGDNSPSQNDGTPAPDTQRGESHASFGASTPSRQTGSRLCTTPSSAASHAHVSMKKVYGLYTGPEPPQTAVFSLLGANSPLLRQSLAHQQRQVGEPTSPSRLKVDREKIGILGTPLSSYDDVLAGIDYEREQKEETLKFLGTKSSKAGVSRVAGVIPYLLLPSKFFSPDA